MSHGAIFARIVSWQVYISPGWCDPIILDIFMKGYVKAQIYEKKRYERFVTWLQPRGICEGVLSHRASIVGTAKEEEYTLPKIVFYYVKKKLY